VEAGGGECPRDLAEWPVKTDRETDRRAWSSILRLAVEHRLTLYDAAYLELAARRGLALATLDGDTARPSSRVWRCWEMNHEKQEYEPCLSNIISLWQVQTLYSVYAVTAYCGTVESRLRLLFDD
jgi:hypothetical protein